MQRNSDRLNLFDRLNYLLSADAAEEDDEVFIHMLKYIAHVAAALRVWFFISNFFYCSKKRFYGSMNQESKLKPFHQKSMIRGN